MENLLEYIGKFTGIILDVLPMLYVLKYCVGYAIGGFCCLSITFAHSLDPDQDRKNVGPDLDPKALTL